MLHLLSPEKCCEYFSSLLIIRILLTVYHGVLAIAQFPTNSTGNLFLKVQINMHPCLVSMSPILNSFLFVDPFGLPLITCARCHGDRSFGAADPQICNSLPRGLRTFYISYNCDFI